MSPPDEPTFARCGSNLSSKDNDGNGSDAFEFSEDPQIQELQACKAIFSHLNVDFENRTGSINIPLHCDASTVLILDDGGKESNTDPDLVLVSKQLDFLPPIKLVFKVPDTYPDALPLVLDFMSLCVPALAMDKLCAEVLEMTSMRRDFILYDIIEYVERAAGNLLGVNKGVIRTRDKKLFDLLVDYDSSERRKQFEDTTYFCEICQGDHKGRCCFQLECRHTFCNSCLREYFVTSIHKGEVEKVHCPSYECTRELSLKSRALSATNVWLLDDAETESLVEKALTPTLDPQLLLRFLKSSGEPDAELLVDRYMSLFKKSQYQILKTLLPNRLVDCPRHKCEQVIFRFDLDDKLVLCPKCAYAFCNDCHHSWHARFAECKKLYQSGDAYSDVPIEVLEEYIEAPAGLVSRRTAESRYGRVVMARAKEEYEMDKMFSQMLMQEDGFTLCPRCHAGIEKTDGCNKVRCMQCTTVFCFLCGEIMENNYDHYADKRSPCYRKLFVGMPGAS